MGNHASRRSTAASAACKVVLSDGSVAEFDGGTVAELMLEHPQQLVVEFSSLLSGSKASPLPADHRLEPGRVYVMLPAVKHHRKPSTLSAAEARQVLSRSRSALRSSSFPSSSSRSISLGEPLHQKSEIATDIIGGYSVANRWLFSLNWVARPELGAEGEEGNTAKPAGKMDGDDIESPSTQAFGEVPEFMSKQLSGRLWKPSLHTIVERVPPRKVSHWLF